MRQTLKNLAWRLLFLLRSTLDPLVRFREVSVLCYHSISDSTHETAVTPAAFTAQLEALQKAGYSFVSLEQVVAWVKGKGTLPRKAVALTFDDGYADFATTVLPLLQKYDASAAVFVMGTPPEAWDAPLLTSEALAVLQSNESVTVGWHSATHPNLARLNSDMLEQEIKAPFKTAYFAYPGGNHSPQAASALKDAGYEAAFTIRPVPVKQGMDPYLLPRTVVTSRMSARDVVMRTSKAAQWYWSLTHA